MIDINCHILPGLDDGPQSLRETLAMAKKAAKQGIHTVIATPHHNNGMFQNEKDAIIGAVDYVNAKLREAEIDLMVLPGQEIMMYADIVADLERGLLLPLNESSGYVLLEMPTSHVPSFASQLVFDMQIAGYKPIIAHPEENRELVDNPNRLYDLVKNGALTQLNAASITGSAGKRTEKFALNMLEASLAQFIGSNAYDAKKRDSKLQQAYKVMTKQLGAQTADLLMENSELLTQGKPIIKDAPSRMTKRKGLFSR
ncbi:tyrosine-protein phosphatase [Lentibacillus sp. Marseille-P4043]|uniref:tyrosine-protein phosphatase n=1 Tax=Lentibacillus sp. Marseille-P4043 TaxID=2040293 RepID=UPI000D0BCFC2|nr:CpsB/CapC family capsule biosynthesis tyrosine phosphatase [Lentibacillus sp. Marseille-P4043]